MATIETAAGEPLPPRPRSAGRPRSDSTHQRILDAALGLLTERSFSDFRMEHVAARAGVGKAAIYRRWRSKEELAGELLATLAEPDIGIPDLGSTRGELLAAVVTPILAITETPFGLLIRALASQIATDPALGEPFQARVVRARREDIARVVARGIQRGDLRPEAAESPAIELLLGPAFFRLLFGGELTADFAESVAAVFLAAFATAGDG